MCSTSLWCSQLLYGVHNLSMVFTTSLWCSQPLYGVHNLSMVFTTSLWCSQPLYGVHNLYMVFTTSLWCWQPLYGVHNLYMVFTTSQWCSQPLYGHHPSNNYIVFKAMNVRSDSRCCDPFSICLKGGICCGLYSECASLIQTVQYKHAVSLL